MSIIDNDAVLTEVNELLSQALLKLEGVGCVPFVPTYNDGRKTIGKAEVDENCEIVGDVIVDAEVQLACIKDVLKKLLVKNKLSGGIKLLETFYDSSCY